MGINTSLAVFLSFGVVHGVPGGNICSLVVFFCQCPPGRKIVQDIFHAQLYEHCVVSVGGIRVR